MARPKPTVDQVGTSYPTYEDFLEDLADWKSEQRLAQLNLDARIRQSIEADRATRSFLDTVQDLRSKGQQAYPDFDAVIASSTVNFPADILQAIVEHPQSEHVQYQLAKDPVLAARIASMTNPYQVGMELARLGPPAVASPASTARAGITNAPPPMQPVGSGSKTTVPPLEDLAASGGDDYDKSGYREARRAQLKAVGRR